MLRLTCLLITLMFVPACSRSNNLFLGRVESVVGTHTVVVTDCYRSSVPPPEKLDNNSYRFMPCRDADVRIHNEQLTVNGQSYGKLNASDAVVVDHGVVSINRGPVSTTASK